MTDIASFHKIGTCLVFRLSNRLSPAERADLELYLWEEEALMVEELAGILVRDQVPIDSTERDMVADLLDFFPPEKLHSTYFRRILARAATLAALNVVDEP